MNLGEILKYLADNWFNVIVTLFTAISGTIAYLTWRDSRRGPEIELITPSSSEAVAYTTEVTDSTFSRTMFFKFPLIFQNKGARVGTILGLTCSVKDPSWKYETNRDGVESTESSESSVALNRQGFLHYDPATTIDIRENDTASLTVTVSFTLKDAEPDKRKPEKTFQELMRSKSVTLAVQYQASTSKGKLEGKTVELLVRPLFKS